ncbi:plasmid pRiA4b ORF-3 family protein [Levilactobacillus koreensis]|uniref:plasmid pRiA4b ORF-3 family protein n=1 Tax=Levilactobacillus koreensis TaxID=637971 RepID=UPI000661812F|nr:plasmid pRiA4b ORF-3 family protein [Levilactobacillus koreensis]
MTEQPPVAMEITIKLEDVIPAVWRTLIVPISLRYDQLNVLLQLTFGWENEHLHLFHPKGNQDREYVPEPDNGSANSMFGLVEIGTNEAYPYQDLIAGPVIYKYDFGDCWEHEIRLKHLLTFNELDGRTLPSCVRGSGAAPGEDARGLGEDEDVSVPYDRKALNTQLEKWATAGNSLLFELNDY